MTSETLGPVTTDRFRDRRMEERVQAWAGTWLTTYVALWLVEGVLRKWIVPSLSEPLLFARDGLTVLVFLGLLAVGVPRERHRWMLAALVWILALVAFAAAQVVVTSQPTSSLAVGFLTYAAPVCGLAMVTVLRDRRHHLARVERLMLVILPVQAILTVLQTLSPDGSRWNRIGDSGVGLVTTSEIVRGTGTFISPSGLSAYIVLAVALTVSRVLTTERRLDPWTATLVGSCVLVVVLGGSRGAVLGSIIVLVGAAIWATVGKGAGFARFVRALGAVGAIAVGWQVAGQLFPKVTGAFSRRFTEAEESESSLGRIVSSTVDYLDQVGSVSLLGDGIGGHTLAGIAAGSGLEWYEIEPSRWVAELGVLGLVAVVIRQLLGLWLVAAAWRASRQTQAPLLVLVSLVMAPALLYGAVTAPTTASGFGVTAAAIIVLAWPSGLVSRQNRGRGGSTPPPRVAA